jgi:branched-chain amino acid transport system ATP-binding protein
MSDLLKLERVTMEFGGLRAVGDLDFHIAPEEMVGLIGPNGAGKTTVFNIITGVYKHTRGAIRFNGVSLHNKKANRITALGVGVVLLALAVLP